MNRTTLTNRIGTRRMRRLTIIALTGSVLALTAAAPASAQTFGSDGYIYAAVDCNLTTKTANVSVSVMEPRYTVSGLVFYTQVFAKAHSAKLLQLHRRRPDPGHPHLVAVQLGPVREQQARLGGRPGEDLRHRLYGFDRDDLRHLRQVLVPAPDELHLGRPVRVHRPWRPALDGYAHHQLRRRALDSLVRHLQPLTAGGGARPAPAPMHRTRKPRRRLVAAFVCSSRPDGQQT